MLKGRAMQVVPGMGLEMLIAIVARRLAVACKGACHTQLARMPHAVLARLPTHATQEQQLLACAPSLFHSRRC